MIKKVIAPYLASSLVNLFEPKNKSQIRFIKGSNSIRMNDFSINGSILVTLYSNMLTFGDSDESFKFDGDLLKTMTKHKFNVDHSNPQDRQILYDFGKQMKFNIMQIGRKSNRDIPPAKFPNSPAIMVSGISTKF